MEEDPINPGDPRVVPPYPKGLGFFLCVFGFGFLLIALVALMGVRC